MGSRYVAVLRGLRGDAAEWYRPATQSPLRSGEMQIGAGNGPDVPILGCEWAPAHSTKPAAYIESGSFCASCRRERISANMASVRSPKFGPLSAGRRIDCVWKIDTVRPARPIGFRRKKMRGGLGGMGRQWFASLTIFSRAFSIYF